MKITIDLNPSDPATADILRKLADMVEGQRVPVEVPAPRTDVDDAPRPWRMQRVPVEVPAPRTDVDDAPRPWRMQPVPGRVIPMTPEPTPWVHSDGRTWPMRVGS